MAKSNQAKKNRIGGRIWAVIWLTGITGQITWVIQNQFLSLYIYDRVAPDSAIITWMVVLSTVFGTISTFLMGTLSDSIGKRRIFVLLGYIYWGIATIIFGFTQFALGLVGVTGAAILAIVADTIMTIFANMGKDCGFMSWTTDISNPENRGTIGSVIAIQPMLATIVGTVVFSVILGSLEGLTFVDVNGNVLTLDYFFLFIIVGIVVIVCGVISFFLMKESPDLIPSREKSFIEKLKKPFNFKLLKENKLLFLILLVMSCFFISLNIYMPHILNYFIYGDFKETIDWLIEIMGIGESMKKTIAGAVEAIAMILTIPLLILSSKLLNKKRYVTVLSVALAQNMAGLLVIFVGGMCGVQQIGGIIILLIGTFLMCSGYIAVLQGITVWLKNLFPTGMRAQFEGIRVLFHSCIPTFLGTLVGNFVIRYLGTPITLHYATGDIGGFAPNGWLCLVAFAICSLTFIPLIFAYLESKKLRETQQIETN